MDRSTGRALVRKYADKDTTVRHLISVEGVMRALARHFGEDPERWGLAGSVRRLVDAVNAAAPAA